MVLPKYKRKSLDLDNGNEFKSFFSGGCGDISVYVNTILYPL